VNTTEYHCTGLFTSHQLDLTEWMVSSQVIPMSARTMPSHTQVILYPRPSRTPCQLITMPSSTNTNLCPGQLYPKLTHTNVVIPKVLTLTLEYEMAWVRVELDTSWDWVTIWRGYKLALGKRRLGYEVTSVRLGRFLTGHGKFRSVQLVQCERDVGRFQYHTLERA